MRLPLFAAAAALASAMLAAAAPSPAPVPAPIPVPAPAPAPAFGGSSSEDGLRALTAADFNSTTSQGMWFVEFFSPFCPHCRRFMPTWKDLAEIGAHLEDSSAFYMARVDCTAQGDVCDSQSVLGYPTMFLYQDGHKVAEYSGSRKFSVLKAWIFGRAEDYRRRKATNADAGSA